MRGVLDRLDRALGRLDPCDDPTVERLTVAPVAALVVALAVSLFTYLRLQYHPMQDFGHHLAMAAVVADRGRPGSIYTDLYTPIDALGTNSLLYLLAGTVGRWVGVGVAMRAAMVFYLAGVPLASLYALRKLRRSAWGALVAVPLVYSEVWICGFANFVFAAPFFLLTLIAFYLLLDRPTVGRWIATSVGFVLVFLAHVHVYLWLGVIACAWTFVAAFQERRLRRFAAVGIVALTSVTPSLLLLRRWLKRALDVMPRPGEWTFSNPSPKPVAFRYVEDALRDMSGYLKVLGNSELDLEVLLGLTALAFVCARLTGPRLDRPLLLELAFFLTVGSFFVLPEHTEQQAVIGSRQLSVAMWLAPVFFEPPPRAFRRPILLGLLTLVGVHFFAWNRALGQYAGEIAGLRRVLAAAPPRQRMHFVNAIRADSNYFRTHVFWHVDKWYMAEKFGQCVDNPAVGGMNPVRYRTDPHKVGVNHGYWVEDEAIWANFDLVLVHGWRPTPIQVTLAYRRGELLLRSGDWELWSTKARAAP